MSRFKCKICGKDCETKPALGLHERKCKEENNKMNEAELLEKVEEKIDKKISSFKKLEELTEEIERTKKKNEKLLNKKDSKISNLIEELKKEKTKKAKMRRTPAGIFGTEHQTLRELVKCEECNETYFSTIKKSLPFLSVKQRNQLLQLICGSDEKCKTNLLKQLEKDGYQIEKEKKKKFSFSGDKKKKKKKE